MSILRQLVSMFLAAVRIRANCFDDGSKIVWVNRESYEYVDPKGRRLEIEAPLTGTGHADRVLDSRSIGPWLPPHEKETLTQEERADVLAKCQLYFRRVWVTYKTESGSHP